VARMATLKIFSLGGLDKKSNDLTRAPEKASDMVNMEYDTQSTLKKRNGYEIFSNLASDDIVYYNSANEFLLFQNNSPTISVLNQAGALTKTLNLPSGISPMTNISISYCENQNNLYFTNTDYSTYVMKYDGSNLYRAGLPTPRVANVSKQDAYPTFTGGVVGSYTRIFYSYKDINGNVTYSPYYQTTNGINLGASTLTIGTLKIDANFLENGFFDKYCFRTSGSSATISSASLTLNTTKHNYVAGDKFLIDTENKLITLSPSSNSYIVLEVESVVANTSITFTAASVGANTITFAAAPAYATEYPVDVRCKIHLAVSSNPESNYFVFTTFMDNSVSTMVRLIPASEYVFDLGRPGQQPFEDLYDSSTLKIMPPICKYISSYGNQIVYGSILSFFTAYNANLLNAPNQRVQYANDDLIVYSDLSTGDGPENVSELNLVKIGETWDGEITGLRRCNDSMVIFKNRGVFSIDGALIDGEFQIRKINTNFAGCTFHKSILEADEGVFFQAHNGIYFTNAIGVKKISYELDVLFQSQEYTTLSARFKKKQKALFYVSQLSSIIVIDYYYNQIYIWNSVNASKGIIEDKDGNIFFSNGIKVYKFNNGYSDAGSAINASYSTTWHHMGEPSLNKKFLSLRTFSLTNDAFNLSIKTQGDWVNTDLTSDTLSFSATDQTKFLMLNMQTKKALRFIFSNNTNNQNLVITGYEVTFEIFNNVDKN
jgi:hypothetical protein